MWQEIAPSGTCQGAYRQQASLLLRLLQELLQQAPQLPALR